MRKRMSALFIMMALMATLLGGCQGGGATSDGDIKIFFSMVESVEYYEAMVEVAQNKAAEAGVQLDAEYAEWSIEAQDEQIKRAVEGDYDVIICSPVSPDTVTAIKAAAGDIPIVFINSAPDDSLLEKDKYIYVASNEETAGQYQAEYVLEQFADKEEINVVLFLGNKGHSATAGRTEGVKRVLEASGKTINYVFEDYAYFVADKSQEQYEVFMKTNIPVDCVIGNNDNMAMGAVTACENANINTDNMLFLGIDATAEACQAIKDGRMDFTVYQSTGGQSEAAVEAAIRLANGESIQGMEGATEDGKYVWIPFEKVDSSNVAQYMSE